mgnify:CR=1 FL=1
MSRNTYVLLATLGSAALLLGAFAFQHLGGLAPCKLCLWQRWPHAAAIIIGIIVLFGAPRALIWFGALAVTATGAIGVYHPVEDWTLARSAAAIFLSMDAPSGLVMCDEIVWQMFGLSMAGWNAVISVVLLGLWVAAARARR